MSQIFHPVTNILSRVSILGGAAILGFVGLVVGGVYRSPYVTQAQVIREQPVPFSHKHHVSDIGIDCRYCHTTVEEGPIAGIPPVKTCMGCHSQIWSDSPMLEPIREAWRTGVPVRWTRVHDLPDFAYFDHSIHVAKGVGCVTCHGQVDQMPLMWKEATLFMESCLDCHRNPEAYVRPKDKVFDMNWKPEIDQETLGAALVEEYGIQGPTNCSTCHR